MNRRIIVLLLATIIASCTNPKQEREDAMKSLSSYGGWPVQVLINKLGKPSITRKNLYVWNNSKDVSAAVFVNGAISQNGRAVGVDPDRVMINEYCTISVITNANDVIVQYGISGRGPAACRPLYDKLQAAH